MILRHTCTTRLLWGECRHQSTIPSPMWPLLPATPYLVTGPRLPGSNSHGSPLSLFLLNHCSLVCIHCHPGDEQREPNQAWSVTKPWQRVGLCIREGAGECIWGVDVISRMIKLGYTWVTGKPREAIPDSSIAWCFLAKGLGWWTYELVLHVL